MFKKYFMVMLVVFMTIVMSTTVLAKENLNKKKTYGERFVEKLERDLMMEKGDPKVEIELVEDDDKITVYSYYTNRTYHYIENVKFEIEGDRVNVSGMGSIKASTTIEVDYEAIVDREEMLSDDTTISVYIGMHLVD